MLTTSMLGKRTPVAPEQPEESQAVVAIDRPSEPEPVEPEQTLDGIEERFRPEPGPNFNNRLQAIQRLQAVASAMQSQSLFDLLHKDALKDCPRVWIVGGGPSAKDFDFSILKGEVVIVCNRCYEIPEATAVVFMDKPFLRYVLDKKLQPNPEMSFRLWKSFKGPKIGVAPPSAAVCQVDDDPYFVIDSSVRNIDEELPKPWLGINHSNNSGLSAFKLALGLGAKEIHLIGVDLNQEPPGQQTWHHAGYPKKKETDCYANMVQRFHEMEHIVNKAGIKVVNHNPASAVECFSRVSLPTAPVGFKKPTVIGFYTINTPYEEEIKGMEKSLRFFGFDVMTTGVPSRNTWSENCYFKPTFIRQMMEANPDKQLIWADADARMRRYPIELFDFLKDNKTFSVATPFVDWRRVNPAMVRGRNDVLPECSSAFIVINNTVEAYDVICKWETLCKETMEKFNSGKLRAKDVPVDDRLLEQIYYGKMKFRKNWVKLPVAYSQIFDLAKNAGIPVVEQMQASRRNKKFINEIMPRENVAYTEDEFLTAKIAEDYRSHWSSGLITETAAGKKFRKQWTKFIGDKERVLDVGCGSGGVVSELRNSGMFVRGCDITLEGVVKYNPDVIENVMMAPAWIMPYTDNHFDHVVCIDVLQHIPLLKIHESLQEMFRVTKNRLTFMVSTEPCDKNGVCLHKTVNPVEWWQDTVLAAIPPNEKYDIIVMDSSKFIKDF